MEDFKEGGLDSIKFLLKNVALIPEEWRTKN